MLLILLNNSKLLIVKAPPENINYLRVPKTKHRNIPDEPKNKPLVFAPKDWATSSIIKIFSCVFLIIFFISHISAGIP